MAAREQGVYQRERDVMRRQVVHLKRLVDDLLDVSRIARGKLELNMGAVDLCLVVAQAVEAANAAKQRGPAIAVQIDTRAWVHGDESRLVQVVSNLLSNAVRFGGDGAILVTVELDDEGGGTGDDAGRGDGGGSGSGPGGGLAAAGRQVRLRVRDHGAGMQPAMIAHIFEPFYQAPQPLARATGGLGLGLAIASNIVQLHGGRIGAVSDGPAQGSTFEVLLPAIAQPCLLYTSPSPRDS